MELEKTKAIIEAILFAAGRIVKSSELILVLEKMKKRFKQLLKACNKIIKQIIAELKLFK